MSQKPDWWTRARELEAAGKLKEAEDLLHDAIPCQAFALEIAEMYRDRMIRLRQSGNHADADAARSEAVKWAHFYASQATSGGEGTAMSVERDAFLATLGDPAR